ncbi:Tubulin-specific chaperone E [Acromyrmex echinatior]|uniref:Tubulin-specific chaperone E n=1 Tax=Acromyrmex echinatior TaxID=103372 RepID=F4WHJ2_ACREC|nr:Tubulin-specific chaperone E [Acromyrmex echinatior]
MVEDRKYEIPSRIECDGYRGTLKYVGPVGNTKGEWLGIDWDDSTRGKHNGTYEGVEYFQARHSTSGSFIRPGKAKFGISCPQAIKMRYGLIDDELAGIDRDEVSTLRKEMNAPFLELVGFSKVNKKQSKFDQLKIVWLREQCVSNAGEPQELEELCPNLEELDLSRNLINSWKIVANICSQLRSLMRLNVSLEYLNLNLNKIDRIRFSSTSTDKTASFPILRQLHISENLISEWQSISELDKLSNLEDLKFRGNPILENETVETARQLVIARIAKLKILNGTEILHDERRGAEYDYLKLYLPLWLETESNLEKRTSFINEHPQYPILVDKYGIADIPSAKPKVEMISNVITVEFVCPDDPHQPRGIKRKLLKDMEVQKMIGLAQRLFKTGGKIPALSFIPRNLSNNEISLDKPLQELSYYSIQDGDQVLVRW